MTCSQNNCGQFNTTSLAAFLLLVLALGCDGGTPKVIREFRCADYGSVELLMQRVRGRPKYCEVLYVVRDSERETVEKGALGVWRSPMPGEKCVLLRNDPVFMIATLGDRTSVSRVPDWARGDSWASVALTECIELAVDFESEQVSDATVDVESASALAKDYVRSLPSDEVKRLEASIWKVGTETVPKSFEVDRLRDLPSLEVLSWPLALTMSDVMALNQCNNLRCIYLQRARMNDSDLEPLKKLGKGNGLCLPIAGISGEAVEHLRANVKHKNVERAEYD